MWRRKEKSLSQRQEQVLVEGKEICGFKEHRAGKKKRLLTLSAESMIISNVCPQFGSNDPV